MPRCSSTTRYLPIVSNHPNRLTTVSRIVPGHHLSAKLMAPRRVVLNWMGRLPDVPRKTILKVLIRLTYGSLATYWPLSILLMIFGIGQPIYDSKLFSLILTTSTILYPIIAFGTITEAKRCFRHRKISAAYAWFIAPLAYILVFTAIFISMFGFD